MRTAIATLLIVIVCLALAAGVIRTRRYRRYLLRLRRRHRVEDPVKPPFWMR